MTPGSPVAVLQLIRNCFRILTRVMPSGVLAQAPVPAEWGAGGRVQGGGLTCPGSGGGHRSREKPEGACLAPGPHPLAAP